MNLNVPSIASSAHAHTTYHGAALCGGLNNSSAAAVYAGTANAANIGSAAGVLAQFQQKPAAQQLNVKVNTMATRRLVQVVIVDPNENISLEDCLLFKGEEKLTDATDQELFFELDIKDILEKHNTKRITVIDKKVKDRTEYLEPAKIRDLKMVVVNVASF
jgi:hypothetical protein